MGSNQRQAGDKVLRNVLLDHQAQQAEATRNEEAEADRSRMFDAMMGQAGNHQPLPIKGGSLRDNPNKARKVGERPATHKLNKFVI